jgi:ATP phosphoribosyltransferase
MTDREIRLAIPSKGVLQKSTAEFLASCGMDIQRANPRQYEATIPTMPGVKIIFQRPGDIVQGVRQGSLDFGISGLDIVKEMAHGEIGSRILILHEALGYGGCTLNLAVPDNTAVYTMSDLAQWAKQCQEAGQPLRIATKFPNITAEFLDQNQVQGYKLTSVEGTLEIAPVLGYADMIADLVSTGITLRDNHLRPLTDGTILYSQACLIANRQSLQMRDGALKLARALLEYMEAHLRAQESYIITANMRAETPESIADCMVDKKHIGGLQGPTISRVVAASHLPKDQKWFAVNIVVQKKALVEAIAELRSIGGSGVIVSPCTYIFEEEPKRYQALLNAL